MNRKIGHLCAAAIIYRTANPEEIFVNIKTVDYPSVVWRGCICLIGGNWTGNAFTDHSPKETFLREMREELQLVKHVQNTTELGETIVYTKSVEYRVKGVERIPTPEEEGMLDELKEEIENATFHFGDYILTIPREVFLKADPQSLQTSQVALLSVFEAGLDEANWEKLVELQQGFGNLSCESESCILAIDEIIRRTIFGQAGQDQILQRFFEQKGIAQGRRIPMKSGVIVEPVGSCLGDYGNYLERFDVERRPIGW